MFKIDVIALELRFEAWLREQEEKWDRMVARWEKFQQHEREAREWIAHMCPTAVEREHERQMARDEMADHFPHVTDFGLDFLVWANGILWYIEMAEYIITGRFCKRWQDEIARQQCQDDDDRLLSYAY